MTELNLTDEEIIARVHRTSTSPWQRAVRDLLDRTLREKSRLENELSHQLNENASLSTQLSTALSEKYKAEARMLKAISGVDDVKAMCSACGVVSDDPKIPCGGKFPDCERLRS